MKPLQIQNTQEISVKSKKDSTDPWVWSHRVKFFKKLQKNTLIFNKGETQKDLTHEIPNLSPIVDISNMNQKAWKAFTIVDAAK